MNNKISPYIKNLAVKKYNILQDTINGLVLGNKVKGRLGQLLPNDLIDLRYFYLSIASEDLKLAINFFENFDTDIREIIPLKIVNLIEENL
jgi:hypothetical protein